MGPIDVVISGIGGRFPKSRNIEEFSDNLLSGRSLLKRIDRWPEGMLNTPTFAGLTDDVDKFDNTFFGVHSKLVEQSDPHTRLAIETAFEAIIDAGINPATIRGSNAHVYSANIQTEDDCYVDSWDSNKTPYIMVGRSRAMNANRISFCFNLSGSSATYDASCAWLGAGLALARAAIQNGECDTVFVNASSVMVVPEISRQKQTLGLLSPDSKCRSFAIDANGVPRGEAQVTFLVQRADIAKRSYGSIVLAETRPELSLPDWFLSLNRDRFQTFVSSLYSDSGLNPNKVKLLEADGQAIKDMVEVELNVLDEVLNKKRPKDSPLLVGTVKSVAGDAEGSAGHVALTKLILAMETGVISPTLDCENLNPNLRGLAEGRLKLVTQPTEWDVTPDTHVAVSSLSQTGLVSHVVLRANGKAKPTYNKNDYPLPYLILISGRCEDFVRDALNKVAFSTFDPEYLRLTHDVFARRIDKFEWKGYGLHESGRFVIQQENRRPVWFVYSGMGTQWPGMGEDLMLIPTMKETFQRLHKILEPKGVDLMNILTTHNKDIFNNVLHCFVGITAMQIALTNLLRQLDIVPEGMIGHSVGELGCSYADDCLTEEETILASYERGVASLKAELIPGLMAAVGLGYEQCKDLPPDVYVACHNSADCCTISGPIKSVKKAIKSFKARDIFVRGVNASNIAFHSPYIKPAAPLLLESLRKVIKSRKLRSSKWICTSAPKEKWDTDGVRYCSAEYHTNNLLSPVLFEEGSEYIPQNALVIEIAPHGLLQAIMKRSLGKDVAHVPLTKHGAESPSKFLLEAIGKLFLEGQSPKIWSLYPDVEMPVSRSTPSLTPLIKWVHEEGFPSLFSRVNDPGEFYKCKLHDSCPSMEIATRKCLPAAHALVQIYNRFMEILGAKINSIPVIFEGVRFYELITFEERDIAEVVVKILPQSGAFSVTKCDNLVVSGKIRAVDINGDKLQKLPNIEDPVELSLSSDDIYCELETHGVIVPNNLKIIQEVNIHQHDWIAKIRRDGDDASLLNSFITLFQLGTRNVDKKPAFVSHIRELIIDSLKNIDGNYARLHLPSGTVVCSGVSMYGVEFQTIEETTDVEPVALRFVPFGLSGLEDETQFLSSVLQLNSEKRWRESAVVKICVMGGEFTSITDKLHGLLKSNFKATAAPNDADLIVCGLNSISAMASTLEKSNNLLLTRCRRSDRNNLKETLNKFGLHIITECDFKGSNNPLIAISSLLPPIQPSDCRIIKMKPHEPFPAAIENTKHRFIIFVWENDTFQPIEKMLGDLRCTNCADKIRIVVLVTPGAQSFTMSLLLLADQMRLNVPLNVFVDGKWGNYRLLPIPAPASQLLQNAHKNLAIQAKIVLNYRRGNIVDLEHASIKVYDVPDHKRRQLISKETVMVYSAVCSAKYPVPSNIIGVAVWDDKLSYFVPDPALFWTVTEEWCCDDTAPMLFSYAMAYYILFELAQLEISSNILITCPLTSIGQAVIRVATSLDCKICILVPSVQEKEKVGCIFPKLKADVVVSSSDTFGYILNKNCLEGFHLIVSDLIGSRLRASTDCLRHRGTFVQLVEDRMLIPDYIGMYSFMNGTVFCGVLPQSLLNISLKVRRKIQKWVDDGLKNDIVVPDIKKSFVSMNGCTVNGERERNESSFSDMVNGHHRKQKDTTDLLSKMVENQMKSALIIGGSKAQWLSLSYYLAQKGCKTVAVVHENPSQNLVTHHSKILHREFNMELKNIKNVRSAADLITSDLGKFKSIFVFGKNSSAEEIVRGLNTSGLKDVRVLHFSESSGPLIRECERWAQNGLNFRAALGVGEEPICRGVLDWLLSPSATAVNVLSQQVFLRSTVTLASLNQSGMLPTSLTELQALGANTRTHSSPVFREIVTRGLNLQHKGEVNPLFFIKGIHGNASIQMETLGAGLLAPLVEITLHGDCGSLEATAAALVQGILRIQSEGPYNVAGDAIRSDVAVKVARILEDKGKASVVFLMNEKIADLREGLCALQRLDRLGEELLTSLSDTLELKILKSLPIGKMEWSEQVQTAVSKISGLNGERRDDVVAALHHVHASVQHILESREDAVLENGIVRLLRSGEDYREYQVTNRRFQNTVPSANLERKELSEFFSSNLATPCLQLEFDRKRNAKSITSITNISK